MAKLNAGSTIGGRDITSELDDRELKIVIGTTAPTDTTRLWIDSTTSPNILKRYDGSSSTWVQIGSVVDQSMFVNTDGDTMTGALTINNKLNVAGSLPNPTVTLTKVGTTAANTTYTYYVVAEFADGTRSMGSASIACYSAFSTSNYVTISWNAVPNAVKYYILRNSLTVLLTTITDGVTTSFNDQGQATTAMTGVIRNASSDVTFDSMLNLNSTNGFLVVPVGTNKYAT